MGGGESRALAAWEDWRSGQRIPRLLAENAPVHQPHARVRARAK